MRPSHSLSALTWVVGPPPCSRDRPSPCPAPPQHPSRLHQEVAALGFGIRVEVALPSGAPSCSGDGWAQPPERRLGSGVSQAPAVSPRAGTRARLLDKGVSQGGSIVGPRHQELIGRATPAPVTPGAQEQPAGGLHIRAPGVSWGLLGLHLHWSHFPISFC